MTKKLQSPYQKTCKSVSNQLKTLIRLKHVLRFEERKMLVNAFVMSSFNYCSLVWNLSSAQMCSKIENLQERTLLLPTVCSYHVRYVF